MAFPPHLPAQVQDFAAKVKAALGSFFRAAAKGAVELRSQLLLVVDKLLQGIPWGVRLPSGKGRMIVVAAMGGVAILMLVIAGASLLARNKSEDPQAAAASAAPPVRQGFIPPDELFLPDEPDFVPGVLLEREQRAAWTAGDAEPLWQDPLKDGEEPWRNRIEQTIDEIMESVP